ncbi:MAG: fatty acid desaturase [Pseudomonadota bacterium]
MEATFANTIKVSAKDLKALRARSDAQGWLQTLGHLGAIVINTILLAGMMNNAWAVATYPFWGAALTVLLFMTQGILINCLYAGVHELSHYSVFKSRKTNERLGRLFCFILLMGRDQDKFEHYQHHRHTQDVELDAEIVGGKPFNLFTYLLYFSGISYWPGRVSEVIRLALGRTDAWPHLSETQFATVHKEARLSLLGYGLILIVSVVLGTTAALTYWLLPMFCMKWFHMLQNIGEHTGMPHDPDILLNTRTLKANVLMRRLLWNMPYHTAHHSYPMVPFYRLPELHAKVVEALNGEEPPTISHWGFQKHMLRKLWQEGSSRYSGKDISAY